MPPFARLLFNALYLWVFCFVLSALDPFVSNGLAEPPASSASDPEKGSDKSSDKSTDKVNKPEEEDYSGTPFTEYGEFNESGDEEDEQKFFQYGRFFGVSLGLGFEFVDGNRGALWQGGFPLIDFKLHYWFDFNVALDVGASTVNQNFTTTVLNLGNVSVNMLRVGVDLKYYFDTRNLSAAVSFANPYLLVGAGAWNKTENSIQAQSQDTRTSLGVSLGAGLEFTMTPRKTYFEIEGKMNIIGFSDNYSTAYSAVGLPDLTGNFYTLSANLLFTW